jgi:hypothetical protein
VGTLGDANFDGRVDAMDFTIWNQHKFQYVQGPRNGDFNGDGAADAADFNIWNTNRFTRPAAADDDSTSERVPRAAAGTGLRMGASITVVGQVFNLSGQDEILSYGTTLNDAPVQRTSQRIDFVMAQVDAEQITSADAHDWVGNRRTRRDTSTVVSRSGASQPADDAVNDIDAKLVDKLFSSLGDA